MTPEQQAAYVYAQAVAASIEMEAMKAENASRSRNNLSPAYTEIDFMRLIEAYGIHHNAVLTTFN